MQLMAWSLLCIVRSNIKIKIQNHAYAGEGLLAYFSRSGQGKNGNVEIAFNCDELDKFLKKHVLANNVAHKQNFNDSFNG